MKKTWKNELDRELRFFARVFIVFLATGGLLGLLFWAKEQDRQTECDRIQIKELIEWAEAYPSLRPMCMQALEDNKLLRGEWLDLKKETYKLSCEEQLLITKQQIERMEAK